MLHTNSSASIDGLRVLLIQARNTFDMEKQEQDCFLERCRLEPDQLVGVNLAHESLSEELLEDADALLIGGAGEYSALDNPPWMAPLLRLVRTAGEHDLPTFGSCWGHQVIARAYGGRLVHDSARAELGCRWIELTEAGRRDPLFKGFPPRFPANTGHHDRVDRLPPGAVELAFNDSQRNQAFRLKDRPVYGTQFHSELDPERERERLIKYRDYYREELPDDKSFRDVLASLRPTPEVDDLLYDFLTTYAVHAGAEQEAP